MSPFNFCVVLCLVLVASVKSYVVREKYYVSFDNNADPAKVWTLETNSHLLDEVSETMPTSELQTVETTDREGLSGGGCAIGYKKAGPTCVKDEDYEFDSGEVETGDRDGIAGVFKNCPEGYKRAGPACVQDISDFEDESNAAMPLEVERPGDNRCPIGFKKAGPACVRDDYDDSDEDES